MFDFSRAFQSGYSLEGQPFVVTNLGELEVPSGRIVACDPLVYPDSDAFTRQVKPGRYPVLLSIAQLEDDDERVAFAMLKVSEAPIVAWEAALVAGQEVSTLAEGEFFGHEVDSGLACFMDVEAQGLLITALEAVGAKGDYSAVVGRELDNNYKDTRYWALHRPLSDDPRNVALFSSGFGDGCYSSWFGLDAGGNVAALVTDFLIGELPQE